MRLSVLSGHEEQVAAEPLPAGVVTKKPDVQSGKKIFDDYFSG